ncbi:MAG: acyl-[ACP]--phospholipid O-acyltransferase [Rhodospirillales bacterium]|nr:acyl-[ACP]--phospholipid O-acyltransferase [Rhodospirillales bacterium]MCB9964627.1 acyl-[ACP]--phospholipid O-acyltransferase [Rhodospirillales bacterium]MCB9979917.1 acyl-[ACP]--phospholipid O-acyltransferase [Rhodospirillales bacterium]
MEDSQFDLLRQKRFWPLFVAQFLGAFHDNVFKNALVALLLYSSVFSVSQQQEQQLVTLSAALLILPFILFSAIGGQLADKYPKQRVIKAIKLVEIPVACLGIFALLSGSLILCLIALFALGSQSAFFGPSKYAILPDHLEEKELVGGNALMNTGTFLAILIGTISGTLLVTLWGGTLFVSALMMTCAVVGYLASRQIPRAPAKTPDLKIDWNPVTETVAVLKSVMVQKQIVLRSIFGVSWFYFLGGMFMAQFPSYTKGTIGADGTVLAFFLAVFSVGIGIGGLLNERLLKGRVEAVYVPLAVLGMSFFSIDLYFSSPATPALRLMGIGEFLHSTGSWRILLDVFMIALCGGLFVVPLNAIIQHQTEESERARIIAGAAIIDAIFIVVSMGFCSLLISLHVLVDELFLIFALLNLFVAVYVCRIMPDYLVRSLMQGLFKLLYKVEIKGLEHYNAAGPRAVIVSNHVSLLDPPLLAAFLPGKPMFAVNSFVAEWWFVKPFLRLVDFFPLDPTNPHSMKNLIREVEKDKHCVIFPEGRLTETGALMKVYEGPGMIADKSDAVILPIRLDGVQHTPFARLKGKVPLRNFPKITITILPPRKFKLEDTLKGRVRRAAAARQLYDVMEEMMYVTTDRQQTLFDALLKARHVNGDDAVIAEDAEFKPLRMKKLLQSAVILGGKIAGGTQKKEAVGVMLPNSVGAVITFFALQAYGRVPAMLNFTAGSQAVCSACQTSMVRTVLTSRRFVEMAKLEPLIADLKQITRIIYLEDVRKHITFADKLVGLMTSPAALHKRFKIKPTDPAVILFTSGSEGAPKGVVLSHKNLMSNIVQISSRVDFNRQDIVFNCLPMFHSFGLTGGTLSPILSGIKTFLYPSPLHYRIVPELVYASNATIMFGTDTFLAGYARMASPYDFYRMRYIFAGAEKVREETRQVYADRFGVRILEGYGTTETSPVIAVNSPMHQKTGSVGRFLPGLEYRLDPVPGVEEGGRLSVRGDNVMLGYYLPDRPGILQSPEDGWHDTGDIVDVDASGFVKILGRAKRFAKIAGEMISLASVEAMVQKVYPEAQHAVISRPDSKKGEQLVLVTTQKGAKKSDLSAYASQNGISELAVPKKIHELDKLPLLGTGKTDYTGLMALMDQKN